VSSAITYIKTIDEVIKIHEKTVDVSGGGSLGILNTHSLEAALEHIQNDDYYPFFADKKGSSRFRGVATTCSIR
jgi:death-on-curing protein